MSAGISSRISAFEVPAIPMKLIAKIAINFLNIAILFLLTYFKVLIII
jgi:hypothetical protein